jgi:hypothetical protein
MLQDYQFGCTDVAILGKRVARSLFLCMDVANLVIMLQDYQFGAHMWQFS